MLPHLTPPDLHYSKLHFILESAKSDNPDITLHFVNCDLSGVNFNNTNLGDTSFQRSNLTGATFRNTTIGSGSGAEHQFFNTNLTRADFTGAIINNVQFDDTDFNKTNFDGTEFLDCKFHNPKNITSIEFTKDTTFKNSEISYPPEKEQTFKAAQNFFNKVPYESLRLFKWFDSTGFRSGA
jgi:uncharacterized protein YjbI with pentapeptide repeats